MFQDIRRHQKWLWVVISSAVIISFVVYFNPNQKYRSGDAGGSTAVGTIYGAPLERTEYVAAYQEAELRYLFSYGEWPGRDQVSRQMRPVERETRNRLVLVRKLTDYNIQVPDSSAAAWIAEAFAGKDNKVFRKEDLNLFVQNNLTPRGLQVEDFYRFARHEVGIQHLINVAGLAGRLVTPQEAEVSYRAENEQLETQVVLFSVSNYLAKVKIDATALAGFYTNQAANYRVPERAQVSYVTFGASNYFAQADQRIAQETNLNQRINEIYLQRGTNYYTGTNG
ncbi:MAG: SurA N-terminal domain-containing protein, partial [Verrucomicrobia bacterium]|nr:SurA N-terminal domain-containing protein [Verrucomicrobiota bacterium]